MDLEGLSDDTHLLIFRDDTLTVHNLGGDLDTVNLDASILSNNIVENVKVQNDQNLLDDATIISQVHNLEVIDQNAVFDGSTVKIISDEALLDKFDDGNNSQSVLNSNLKIINSNTVKILDTNIVLDASSMELLNGNSISDNTIKIIDKNTVIQCNSETLSNNAPFVSSTKRKRDEKLPVISNPISISNLNSIEPRKAKTKSTNVKKYHNSNESVNENSTNHSFLNWLASITERINQTMHFQFDGKPDPLVFHVPQAFFECLRERISCGAKKKRLPNSTTAFVRKDGIPLGTFTKYTWQITNILHVKSIFDTPLILLEITRSFIQNADGSYELYKREETEIDRYKKTINNALIKPQELKTFLKVGNTSPNQAEPTPFLIEWIPDILPISKIGELRIRFEFGHVKNESPQRCRKTPILKND